MIKRSSYSFSIIVACLAIPAYAQVGRPSDAFLQQQRRLEDEARAALDRELPTEQKINVDWGGWYSFYTFLYDDGLNSSRTYREHDLRLWGSASLDEGAHQFYARLKLQFADFNHGDSFDRNEDDTIGPNLDRAYYQFDLRQALWAYQRQRVDWDFKLKVGRDLVEFGTGYALSLPMDHILLTAELDKFEIKGLAGTTIHSNTDLDRSRPYSGSTERNFWGTQITYTGFEKHRPFVYAYWNEDQKTENFPVLLQNYDYDTWYIAAGSSGEIVQNLRYDTELVFESGDTYGNREFLKRDNVEAWAYDFGLEYLSQKPMKPRISGEYMFASGDGDRVSPTNSIGGNTRGKDTGFNGFGYRDTGLSLAPLLSNVNIWRLGGAFKPFEECEPLREIELGTDWFLYYKNHADGGISDFTADRQSGYLGWEMDYFVSWRLTSDLSLTTRFGTFFPGQAFSDKTTRTFLLTGVTWSF